MAGRRVPGGVSGNGRRAVLALLPWLGLAACGGLESPDLETGTLRGHLENFTPPPPPASAYVYPLFRPDLKTPIGADGRWVIERVPVETTQVIVFDGVDRARLLPVEVEGAEETGVEDDEATMPLAGRIEASVQLPPGAPAGSPRFTAVGTEHEGVLASGGTADLYPLPEGRFDLAASMQGFRDGKVSCLVLAGQPVSCVVPLEPASP